MKAAAHITCLVDNARTCDGVACEHGLSFLIEGSDAPMLLDAGGAGIIVQNASALGIDLSGIRRIVLSHDHYDHTGGLRGVLEAAGPTGTVLAHPAAFVPKYSIRTGASRSIGLPALTPQDLAGRNWPVQWPLAPTALPGNLHVTGPIPRQSAFEHTGGRFYLNPACTQPDPLTDDQVVYLDTPQGAVVVLGCAHAGVVAVAEPAFWAGFDRRYPGTFVDYFHQISEFEPARAAQYGIQHFCWVAVNPKESENVASSREVRQHLQEFLAKPAVLGLREIGLNKNTANELTIFRE